MSEEVKLQEEAKPKMVGQWKSLTGHEAEKMRLKQTIREVLDEFDSRCPKCKCERKDE